MNDPIRWIAMGTNGMDSWVQRMYTNEQPDTLGAKPSTFFKPSQVKCRKGTKTVQPKTKSPPTEKTREAAQSYRLDDAPGFLLRVALRTHTSIFAEKMIEELTPPQFSTLAKLREVGSCSQNHLGRLIHYDSATITGVINRLKSRGLIKSSKDPLDPRRRQIELTDKGRRTADAAIETIGEISGETFAPLTREEFKTLTEILKKVIRR
ncbi:MarR family winged helix-turn-helix transcriptional regulator [Bradyrhizobium sp. JR3.5]